MVANAGVAEMSLAELLVHHDKEVRELAQRIANKLLAQDERKEVDSRTKYKQ